MVWYVLVHLKSPKSFYGKEIKLPLEKLIEELQNPDFKYSLLIPNFQWDDSDDIRIYTGIWDIDFNKPDGKTYMDVDLDDCVEGLPNTEDYVAWFSGGKGIRVLHHSNLEEMKKRLFQVSTFDSKTLFDSDQYSNVIYPPLQAYLDNIIHPGRGIKFDFQKHPKTHVYPYLPDKRVGGYIGVYYTLMLQNIQKILEESLPVFGITPPLVLRKRGRSATYTFTRTKKTVTESVVLDTFRKITNPNLCSFQFRGGEAGGDEKMIFTNWHPPGVYHSNNKVLLEIKEVQKEKIFYIVHCLSAKCAHMTNSQIHITDRCDAFPGGELERLCDTRLSKESKSALLTRFKSVTHIHEKFLPKTLLTDRSDITKKEIFLVCSTMGTGKTEMIMEYAKKFKKILWISPRRVFAEALAKATGFHSYMDSKRDLYDHDRVIVSLESIPRILRKFASDHYKMQDYDLVVCDEWNAFMNVVCNDTLKDRYLHLKIFMNLVTAPHTSVVLTDAFFGEEEFFAVRRIPGINLLDIHFIYNTNFECDTNQYLVYLSYADWVETLQTSANTRKDNVVIVSTSRNKLVNLMDMLKSAEAEGGDVRDGEYVILTGDTEKAKKKMISIDDWSKFRVFGYTPTMTVGNSFTNLHFHDIFLVVTGNMDYKTVIQMTRRIRRTVNQRVHVYIKYPLVRINSLFEDRSKILQSLSYIDTTRGDLGTKQDYMNIDNYMRLFHNSPYIEKHVEDIQRDAMMYPNRATATEGGGAPLVYPDILNYYLAPTDIEVPLEDAEDGDMENRHTRIEPLSRYIISLFFICNMERKIAQSESRKLLYFNSLIHSACGKNVVIQLPKAPKDIQREKDTIREHKARDTVIGISFLKSLEGIMTKPALDSDNLIHPIEVENELLRKAKNLGFTNLSPLTPEKVETLAQIFESIPTRYYVGGEECYNGFLKLVMGKDVGQNNLSKYLPADVESSIFEFIHAHWTENGGFPDSWEEIENTEAQPPQKLIDFVRHVSGLAEKQRRFICPPISIFKFIVIDKPMYEDQKKKNIVNALRYACYALGLPLKRRSDSTKRISMCCIDKKAYTALVHIEAIKSGFHTQGPNPAFP